MGGPPPHVGKNSLPVALGPKRSLLFANISDMGLLHLVQVTTLLPLVQGGRWVFLGGFSGLEEGGHRVGDPLHDHLDDDADVSFDVDADDDDAGDFNSFHNFTKASGHVELLELSGNNANQEKTKFGDRFPD